MYYVVCDICISATYRIHARKIYMRYIRRDSLCRLFTLGTFPSNDKQGGISKSSACVYRKNTWTK